MAQYTKVFENPYPDGWKNLPSEETPITASALQEHTDAIENIENYLEENPIGGGGGGGSAVEWNQIQTDGKKIAEISIDGATQDVFAPNGGATTEYGTKEEFEAEKDSFPIGTEYLITDDFEEGGSSSIAYSEEETEIGTFLGKKLYSKVFRTTESVTNANKEFTQTDASGIKNIISCTFCVEHTNYAWFIVGQCTIQNNHIYGRGLTGDSPTSGMYTNIVVQYTKE